jgi:hypothetical protein
MSEQEAVFFVFLLLIMAGLSIVVLGMRHRSKVVEMEHRERLAMIEKGLLPAPERDPRQFYNGLYARRRASLGSPRALSIGIVVIGFGLGLALLIGFAGGAGDVAVGIGGAIAVLGAAFVVNALVNRSAAAPPFEPAERPGSPAPPPPGPGPER